MTHLEDVSINIAMRILFRSLKLSFARIQHVGGADDGQGEGPNHVALLIQAIMSSYFRRQRL